MWARQWKKRSTWTSVLRIISIGSPPEKLRHLPELTRKASVTRKNTGCCFDAVGFLAGKEIHLTYCLNALIGPRRYFLMNIQDIPRAFLQFQPWPKKGMICFYVIHRQKLLYYQLPVKKEYHAKYALEKVPVYPESDNKTANIPSVDERSD